MKLSDDTSDISKTELMFLVSYKIVYTDKHNQKNREEKENSLQPLIFTLDLRYW